MATETVKIGGKPVSKKILYGGGAVALGVVGYAWYTSSLGGTATAEPEEELPEPVPEPTDEPGFDVVGGGPPPTTNADWNAKAIQSLLNIGYDAVAAQAAIGKFLQRRSLTSTEAALVEAAIAAAGYPPENGPWVIIRETPGTTAPPPTTPKLLPPPSTVRATGGKATLTASWVAVAGASGYEVRYVRGYPQGSGGSWVIKPVTSLSHRFIQRVTKPATYTVEVRTVNAAGKGSPRRSGPVKVIP